MKSAASVQARERAVRQLVMPAAQLCVELVLPLRALCVPLSLALVQRWSLRRRGRLVFVLSGGPRGLVGLQRQPRVWARARRAQHA